MVKYLLLGDYSINAGPSNVNRNWIKYFEDDFSYVSGNSIKEFGKILKQGVRTQVIIFSGLGLRKVFLFTCIFKYIFRKKIIYIMHGYLRLENQINHLKLSNKYIRNERAILNKSDIIICVSERYAEWIKEKFPGLKQKVKYINNGVDFNIRPEVCKIPYTVAVTGGNCKIKNNLEVCQAIKKLNDEGIPCKLYIFGEYYEFNEDLSRFEYAEYIGQLDKDEYYRKLDHISLMVLNSEIESFGLVVADAINCNCALLMSENVGALSIMDAEEADIVHNPHDVDELCNKMKGLFANPNSKRLYKGIDLENSSTKAAYMCLKKICENLGYEK